MSELVVESEPPGGNVGVGRRVVRVVAYTWAAPTTMVGLLAGALTLGTGGRVQRRRGALEFHGGFSRWLGKRRGFGAMTLAHVRQVERWGPAFIPAYLLASAWAWVRGQHYYLDNWFERDARRACGERW